jgi:CHAT domain-containing protein/tetratricopeptide (TPR) repeat protein
MRRAHVVIAITLLVAARAFAQDLPAEQGSLTAGAPIERELPARATHAFPVTLVPGHVYAIDVEQLATYVEITWAAEGKTQVTNDRPGRSGHEEAFWVAASAGPATLSVRNLGSQPGRYRVTLAEPRPATPADRERHQAESDATARDMAARRRAADRFGALGLVHRQVRVLDRMSYLGVGTGASGPAREAAEECVTRARATALEDELASCLCALANVVQQAGDLDRATALYDEAVALAEARGDPGRLAAILHDSAGVMVVRGEYDAAERVKRRSLALARQIGDEQGEMTVEVGLGTLAAMRGDLEAAVGAFEQAAATARRLGHAQAEAIARVNASIAYGNLGDVDRSLACAREAAEVAEGAGLKPVVAMARLSMGAEHADAGDLDTAKRELTAGIALAREAQALDHASGGAAQLGWVLADLGEADAAEKSLADAMAFAVEAGAQNEQASALLYLGKARTSLGRLDAAEEPLAQARTRFEALGRVDIVGQVRTEQARLALARGDLRGAAEHAEGALAQFESVRTLVALGDQRARYAAFRREAYDVAIAVRLQREKREPRGGHRAAAFLLTERARARTLQEELASRRAAPAEVPDALADRHRRALDRIGHVQRKLVEGHTSVQPDAAALGRLDRELADAVAEEEATRREILLLEPRARVQDGGLSPAEVQARLGADEALLEYHVGTDASWLFVVTREHLEVALLPGARALRAQVDALRALLSAPRTLGATQYAAAAHGAFRVLVAPALAGRPRIRRLVVVPDGPLWEVPFEALLTEAAPAGRFASFPYLLRRFTVSYRLSAAGAAAGPGTPTTGAQLVAFADPPPPGRADQGPALAGVERAVFREGVRWSLPPLPCARQEARDSVALFGPRRAQVHTGAGAIESRVKSDPEVAKARYLLFSTHALVSDTMPSQSALVLSLAGDGAEDGLLQAYEIDRLRLSADLVVLSACETALGQNVRGEGLLGLARSFFHAGARRLLASQWRVADCSTAHLVTDFFRRLQAAESAAAATDGAAGVGPDLADALRRAKLRLLEGAYSHPYYWAPFVLVG